MAHGSAIAIVVATGVNTRFGEISSHVHESRTPIPLERDLKMLSRLAVGIIFILTIAVFALGIRAHISNSEMIFIAIAVAVSAIPEGLPAVLTIVLATGMWRMARRGTLIKKMYAVEALGQIKILALDKTGTLTFNEMMVTEFRTPSGTLRVSGDGYNPHGAFFLRDQMIELNAIPEYVRIAALLPALVQARVTRDTTNTYSVNGDPTEAALFVLAQKMGVGEPIVTQKSFPFDYQKKISLAEVAPYSYALAGAPEAVLATCTTMSAHEQGALAAELQLMTEHGHRVVAIASRQTNEPWWDPEHPREFIFEAFLGIADAVRPEAARTVARVKGAGVKVVMITGDHPATARAVAHEVGIFERGDHVLTGKELHTLPEQELHALLPRISVFARVSPEDKLKIISLYQRTGHSVAMTGDGVNDAPSLVAADIGIAMAKTGTDVARSAADILLLNDNLESIVVALDEGRTMYQSIRRVLVYLFATNFGEICVITTALALQIPLPILAIQILWLNFVTDGFFDVALALEPKEEGSFVPRPHRTKYLLHATDFRSIAITGVMMTIGTLWVFMYNKDLSLEQRHTAALLVMSCFQWVSAWMSRTQWRSFFTTSLWHNSYLVGATIIVFALQLCAVYVPAFQTLLHTARVPALVWVQTFVVASSIVVVEELRKFRRRAKVF